MFTSVIELTDIINYVGDFKRPFVEGSQIVKCNHIVEFGCKENTPNLTRIIAMCLKTSDLSGKPHELEVIKTTINDGQVTLSGKCSCKAGSGKCKHIVGLLLKLQKKIMICTSNNSSIEVHPLTDNPTKVWDKIKKSQKVLKIQPPLPKGPVGDTKVRVVCMSDTHSKTHLMNYEIPSGDIFIHAGDFTSCGEMEEIKQFNEWLGQLPHTYKIVIAGNHELSFDPKFVYPTAEDGDNILTLGYESGLVGNLKEQKDNKKYLTNCIYLEDSMVECYGLKIYGSPWQPVYGGWAFNIPRGQPCLDKWNQIPDEVDILITHTPPLGHGDHCNSDVRAGCVELLSTVQKRVKPKYHIFGHIHEDYGITSDGKIIYINASSCNLQYIPVNPPIIFDIALPKGFTKNSS